MMPSSPDRSSVNSASFSPPAPTSQHRSDLDKKIKDLSGSIKLGAGRLVGGHESSDSLAGRLGKSDCIIALFQECSMETGVEADRLTLFAEKLKPILRGFLSDYYKDESVDKKVDKVTAKLVKNYRLSPPSLNETFSSPTLQDASPSRLKRQPTMPFDTMRENDEATTDRFSSSSNEGSLFLSPSSDESSLFSPFSGGDHFFATSPERSNPPETFIQLPELQGNQIASAGAVTPLRDLNDGLMMKGLTLDF